MTSEGQSMHGAPSCQYKRPTTVILGLHLRLCERTESVVHDAGWTILAVQINNAAGLKV
jgi:hypothetical protein